MSEDKEIRFIRFRSAEEDIVGYVSTKGKNIVIEKPLYVVIDTIFEEGRQILSLQEYLPQSIVTVQEIELKQSDVLFTSPVSETFMEEYKTACEYYYVEHRIKLRPSKKRKLKDKTETLEDLSGEQKAELEDNVVSIMEAILDKRNKPIH